MDPSWTQSAKNALRQVADDGGGARVSLARALGIVSEQVMAAPLGNHMDGHASVEESRLVAAPQIMEAQAVKAELASPFDKASGDSVRITRLGEVKPGTSR
jgi:hypothetical protein